MARDLSAALLPTAYECLGAEHPDTRYRPGAASPPGPGRRASAAAARDLFAVLLPTAHECSGAEHRETLAVRGDLAAGRGRRGGGRGPGPVCGPAG